MRVDRIHELATRPGTGPAGQNRNAHLVGIGGSGMRALATVLLDRGWKISGSDVRPEAAGSLAARGVHVFSGHASNHLPPEAQLLIYSDAVPENNLERMEAQQRGIAQMSYAQMLAQLAGETQAAEGQTIAIAGTHGKSTVTAMTAEILIRAGLDPTVICGASALAPGGTHADSKATPATVSLTARSRKLGATGGRHGEGKLFVVEACEYRENFLQLRPNVSAILNIEPDHFDYYHSPSQLREAFLKFTQQTAHDGLIVASQECSLTQEIAVALGRHVASFGFSRAADWRATNLEHRLGRYRFDLVRHDSKLAHITLAVTGRHNVLNAVAAASLARHCGVSAQHISQGLAAFRGLKRRLEMRGRWGGVPWMDDYAHHPTEVKAALTTVRQMFPRRRIWCVFQPHQASRLAALLDETATSLHNADRIAVAEVYRARENTAEPAAATATDLANLLEAGGSEVLEEHQPAAIARRLSNELQPGDVLLTIGAGDLGKIFYEFHERLRRNCAVA
ncbi:MAG TPA: Mur ligase family protein [Pirellulales bacterium]|jgi:UDP-N-acetylmuramate--alanine ligase|nr:Mur ligase family protein [Pirellulales bacterium]